MDSNVTEYLQRQMALGKQRLRRFVVNPRGKQYPKRNIYVKTRQYVDEFLESGYSAKRWVIIPGLRGTGKTTILAQAYFELQKHADTINVIYFSLDEALETVGADLNQILQEYERLIGESYEVLSKPTFILIDEVQSDPKWAAVLKALNERAAKVFLLCSGSSAIHLQDNADVAGRRATTERLYPMNFCEFEMVKNDVFADRGLKDALLQALYQSSDAEQCYRRLLACRDRVDRYWAKIDRRDWRYYIYAGNLPFALVEKTYADVYDAVMETVDKVVSRDLLMLGRFNPETVPIIKRLLYILAEGDVVSNQTLAQALGITAVTVANILEALVAAELLLRVQPHGSQVGATRKPSKYLFMSSVIRAAFYNIAGSLGTSETREGQLLEDVAGLHYYRNFGALRQGSLCYDSAAGGADFILKTGAEQIAIEVGRGSKSARQIAATMKRITCKYGLTICSEGLSYGEGLNSVKVPWDYFALV